MKIRLYLILGVFISPLLLSAQDGLTTSDNQSFESWNALQIQYAPTEKLSLGLESQLRLKSVGDSYNMSFFEAQAQYELQPFLDLGVGYRNSDRLDDVGKKQGHEKYNRFFGFAQQKPHSTVLISAFGYFIKLKPNVIYPKTQRTTADGDTNSLPAIISQNGKWIPDSVSNFLCSTNSTVLRPMTNFDCLLVQKRDFQTQAHCLLSTYLKKRWVS